MQDYPSLDLEATANFAFQNNPSFGKPQGSIHAHLGVHKSPKNSSFFDDFLKCRQQNTHHDTNQTQQSQLQPQQTLRNMNDFQDINLNRQKGKKNAANFLNDRTKVTPYCSKDQLSNIFPSTLTESLQIHSKFDFEENQLLMDSFKDMNFRQIEKVSHQNSNIEIDMNLIDHMESSEMFQKRQRSLLKKHMVTKQIAITYVPLRYASTQIKKAHMFSKFNPHSKEVDDVFSSSRSLSSNLPFGQNFQLKDCMVNSTANFVKLHEVDLFMKRKQIKIERSDQLLVANERLLTNHLVLKQELQKVRKAMQNLQKQYKSKIESIQHELNQEKQSRKQILADKQAKQSILKNIKALNQQYLKQNNQLKDKIKVYLKNIHELKFELANKRSVEIHQDKTIQSHAKQNNNNSNKTIYVPLPTINSIQSNHDASDRTQVHLHTKRTVTLPAYQVTSIGNLQQRHKLLKANNAPLPISPINTLKIKQRKLSTNEMMIDKFFVNIGNNNTKSQKSIGIKKNNTTHHDIGSNKNLVKIDKNSPSQNSLCLRIGDNHHDRSASNISNTSGVSKSRKLGYIPRPAYENKKGIILDYMAQNEVQQSTQDKARQERFKYKKENI